MCYHGCLSAVGDCSGSRGTARLGQEPEVGDTSSISTSFFEHVTTGALRERLGCVVWKSRIISFSLVLLFDFCPSGDSSTNSRSCCSSGSSADVHSSKSHSTASASLSHLADAASGSTVAVLVFCDLVLAAPS